MKRFVFAIGLLAACAQGNGSNVLTYDEFKAQATVEPETGIYIFNGDEIVMPDDDAALRDVYERYVDSARAAADDEYATSQQGLIVNRVNGHDDRWSTAQAQSLTYCVSEASFGSHYQAVVSALASATKAWEATANVDFVHVSSKDNRCTNRTTGIVFDVRQTSTTQYLARSFFPSTSRRGREVLISVTSFDDISPWTLTGVLRHELGHTLGFRHEHTRPEAGTCFEDNEWRALTAYDSKSVMHYPQCNGTQDGDLVLTTLDKQGAKSLYP